MTTFRAAAWLLILTVVLTACAATGEAGSPSPTAMAASEEPEPTATPEPSPTVTPQPTMPLLPEAGPYAHADYGAHATVAVDRLRLRPGPETEGEHFDVLTAGMDLFILQGPVTGAEFLWYFVEVQPNAAVPNPVGWVAAAPRDADPEAPDDSWLIELGPLTCPDGLEISTELLGRMSDYAILNCGVQVSEVSGLMDHCYEGPLSPFEYSPFWASFSCYYLRDEEAFWQMNVYFPPDLADPMPERGDLVTLTGGLGVNTDRYGNCTITTSEDIPASVVSTHRQTFEAECQTKFVVTSVEITGHIELPPLL